MTVKVENKMSDAQIIHRGIPSIQKPLIQYKCQPQFLTGSFRSSSQIHNLGYLSVKPRTHKPLKREFIIILI